MEVGEIREDNRASNQTQRMCVLCVCVVKSINLK